MAHRPRFPLLTTRFYGTRRILPLGRVGGGIIDAVLAVDNACLLDLEGIPETTEALRRAFEKRRKDPQLYWDYVVRVKAGPKAEDGAGVE